MQAEKPFKKLAKKIVLLSIGCTMLNIAYSQMDKRLVQADQYFVNGEYYTAAHLYGQFLNTAHQKNEPTGFPLNSKRNAEGRTGHYTNQLNILYKQAESYRLANYWNDAAELYLQCYQKDSVQFSTALYWYAVCQRSMGNYAVAEESIDRFINIQPADVAYSQSAVQEKERLQWIKEQLNRPDSVLFHIQKMETSFATEKGFYAPIVTAGNSLLFTSTQTDSVTVPGINPNHNRLFQTTATGGSLQMVEPVAIEGVDVMQNQGSATISADGNYLYFTQWIKKEGKTISSIYMATKKENRWGQPVKLSSVNTAGYNSKQPFITADGKYLFFASDKVGGAGDFDIWYAPLQADGTTGEPVNAGNTINTADNEQAPFLYAANGQLVFASDRAGGMGGYDLFTAKASGEGWNAAENMGHPVNSSRDDVYFFTTSKESLLSNAMVSSDRGSECCLATYVVTKMPKKKLLTGIVKDCKDNTPVADAVVVMKDASGKAFTTTTNSEGAYLFDLTGIANGNQVSAQKELYNDVITDVKIAKANEKGWLVDTLQNEDLCMEKKMVIKVENVVTVYFDYDQSKLKEPGIAKLDSIYNILIENSAATLQISGYTDGKGSVEYNKKLSDKRAKACADYLIEKGIDAARISFASFGACCPVEMELINGRDNPNARSINRRALININKE